MLSFLILGQQLRQTEPPYLADQDKVQQAVGGIRLRSAAVAAAVIPPASRQGE